jgi:hypothetical protein
MGVALTMNRSAVRRGRARIMEEKAFLIYPAHQGVCGQPGREEKRVRLGGLIESPGGTEVSEPRSGSKTASEAVAVVGSFSNSVTRSGKAAAIGKTLSLLVTSRPGARPRSGCQAARASRR